MWNGSRRRFIPDFMVRLTNGKTLVLDIKGVDDDQNRAKRAALATWVQGVNQKGGFGVWAHAVAVEPSQVRSEEHTSELQSLMRIAYAVFCLRHTQTPSTKSLDCY